MDETTIVRDQTGTEYRAGDLEGARVKVTEYRKTDDGAEYGAHAETEILEVDVDANGRPMVRVPGRFSESRPELLENVVVVTETVTVHHTRFGSDDEETFELARDVRMGSEFLLENTDETLESAFRDSDVYVEAGEVDVSSGLEGARAAGRAWTAWDRDGAGHDPTETRSMAVGDVLEIRGRYFYADNQGFVELEFDDSSDDQADEDDEGRECVVCGDDLGSRVGETCSTGCALENRDSTHADAERVAEQVEEELEALEYAGTRLPRTDETLVALEGERGGVDIDAWKGRAPGEVGGTKGVEIREVDLESRTALVECCHNGERVVDLSAVYATDLDVGDRVTLEYDSKYTADGVRTTREATVQGVRDTRTGVDSVRVATDDGKIRDVSRTGGVTTREGRRTVIGRDARLERLEAEDDEDDVDDEVREAANAVLRGDHDDDDEEILATDGGRPVEEGVEISHDTVRDVADRVDVEELEEGALEDLDAALDDLLAVEDPYKFPSDEALSAAFRLSREVRDELEARDPRLDDPHYHPDDSRDRFGVEIVGVSVEWADGAQETARIRLDLADGSSWAPRTDTSVWGDVELYFGLDGWGSVVGILGEDLPVVGSRRDGESWVRVDRYALANGEPALDDAGDDDEDEAPEVATDGGSDRPEGYELAEKVRGLREGDAARVTYVRDRFAAEESVDVEVTATTESRHPLVDLTFRDEDGPEGVFALEYDDHHSEGTPYNVRLLTHDRVPDGASVVDVQILEAASS